MLSFNIFQLTPEQQEFIPIYRNKWQQIACSTEKIDKDRAQQAIKKAYEFIELTEPNVLFVATPHDALDYIHSEVSNSWGKLANTSLGSPVAGDLMDKLLGNIRSQVKREILEQLQGNLDGGIADKIASKTTSKFPENELFSIIWANFAVLANTSANNSDADDLTKTFFKLFFEAGFIFNNYISFPLWQAQRQVTEFFLGKPQTDSNINQMFSILFASNFNNKDQAKYQLPFIEASSRFVNVLVPSVMTDFAYYIDYCHQVLDCDRDSVKWNIFNDLITSCGWIFPYEKITIICDRY